ncbi:hypothetical protein [Halomonas sp. AOP42-D1-22]|uniref:hypothetical protein n=1 Tax=Halomonas sp. AOP42-D1-22 TaxID=3457667 RepID=UPI0040332293
MPPVKKILLSCPQERFYDEHARSILLPLSKASTFHEALKEWWCRGVLYDYEVASHCCELRNTGPSRFVLEMRHHYREMHLRINLTTVLKYNLALYSESGLPIRPADANAFLKEQIRRCYVQNYSLNFYKEVLADADADKYISLLGIDVCAPLLPLHLTAMAHFMHRKSAEFDSAYFKVDLESAKGWRQFIGMAPWERGKLWSSLSDEQLQRCRQHRLIIAQGHLGVTEWSDL